MFKNKITWMDLVEKKDFSIFNMADFLYSDNSSQGLFKKSKFILRSFIYRKELKKMFFIFNKPPLQKIPEIYPRIFNKPLRPYIFASANSKKRVQMIEEHYNIISTLFSEHITSLYMTKGIMLGSYPNTSCSITLGYNNTFRREGEMVFSIMNDQGLRLYSCAFSFLGTIQQPILVIGSIQGPEPAVENPQEIVRNMTKDAYGLRPKSLVVMLVMMLAKSVAAHRILAVKKCAHVFQAKRYSRKQKANLQSDYDELWAEFEAINFDDNFVQLPPQERKSLEEIASKKRSMYRRRYEWLDVIERNINDTFGKNNYKSS